MKTIKNRMRRLVVGRTVGVVAGAAILVSGVTFAILQSQQATLSGNSIQSATADLRIGTTASTFDASRNGFTFKDVVPGGSPMPSEGHTFYLKDYGSAALKLKVVLGGTPTNLSNVDLDKVKLTISRSDGSEQVASLKTLKELGLTLTEPINAGSVAQYKLRAAMDADAYDGTGAAVGGIDLVFSGAAL